MLIYLVVGAVILIIAACFYFSQPRAIKIKIGRAALGNQISYILEKMLKHKYPLILKHSYLPSWIQPIRRPLTSRRMHRWRRMDIHEINPLICWDALPELLKVMPSTNQDWVADGVLHVHMRCGDVPFMKRHPSYLLLEFEWYRHAMELLPMRELNSITLHVCDKHSRNRKALNMTGCAAYAEALRDYLNITTQLPCSIHNCSQTDTKDFHTLRCAHALISGCVGGSYGFWACLLADERTHAVFPTPCSTGYAEIGTRHTTTRDRKHMLDAVRVDYIASSPIASAIDMCRTLPTCGRTVDLQRVCMYINRDAEESRRTHFDAWARSNGLIPERIVPQRAWTAERSLTKAHMSAWRMIARRADGWYAVFEDDADSHPSIEPLWDTVSEWIRKTEPHDFAYLGVCTTKPILGDMVSGRCSHAYIVTPHGASKLLRSTSSYHRSNVIDILLERVVHAPLFACSLQSEISGHMGGVFQNRFAWWYKGSTI